MIDPRLCMFCGTDHTLPGMHSQVVVEWSNKSKMHIGLCKDCASSHVWATDSGKKTVTQWHHQFWSERGGLFDPEIKIV